jgi:hypothetical protein
MCRQGCALVSRHLACALELRDGKDKRDGPGLVKGLVFSSAEAVCTSTIGVVKGTALRLVSRTGFAGELRALAGPKRPIVMSMCWPQRENHKLKVLVLLAIPLHYSGIRQK